MAACLCFQAGTDVRFLTVIPSPSPNVPDTRSQHSGCPPPRGCPRTRALPWSSSATCIRSSLENCSLHRRHWIGIPQGAIIIGMMEHLIGVYSQFAPYSNSNSLDSRGCSPPIPAPAFTQRPALRCLDGAHGQCPQVTWPAGPSS